MSYLPLSRDAATVVGIAGTALAFARTTDDEVERWLRPLRLNGEAAVVLQALAIGESRLTPDTELDDTVGRSPGETLAVVMESAAEFAAQRGCRLVGTLDLLVAIMRYYAEAFERALTSRGSDGAELVDCLAARLHTPLI